VAMVFISKYMVNRWILEVAIERIANRKRKQHVERY
jgi:hypothetical protein